MTNPALTGFTQVVDLMDHIHASGSKFPRVRLDLDGQRLVMVRAGDKSKTPGAVMLTDGGPFGANTYFGRITRRGEFEPARAARDLDPVIKATMWATLSRMKKGEAREVFAEHGKRLGFCCLCGRPLSDAASVEAGIGPDCSKRF
jgi:hypothetical protein